LTVSAATGAAKSTKQKAATKLFILPSIHYR
jgi:hypothetical protein